MTDPMPHDQQKRFIREVVGECPDIQPMPTGGAYIEATCHWHDRSAYILLDRTTGQVLRYMETLKQPLYSPSQELPKRDKCKRKPAYSATPSTTSTMKSQKVSQPFPWRKQL